MNSSIVVAESTTSTAHSRVTGQLESGNIFIGKKIWLIFGSFFLLSLIANQVMDKAIGAAIGQWMSHLDVKDSVALGIVGLIILAWIFYKDNSHKEDSITIEDGNFRFRRTSSDSEDYIINVGDLKSFSIRNFILFKIYNFKFTESAHTMKRGIFVRLEKKATIEEKNFVKQARSLGFPPHPIRFIFPAIGLIAMAFSMLGFLSPAIYAYINAKLMENLNRIPQKYERSISHKIKEREYVKKIMISNLPDINKTLPKKIDKYTILEKATIEGYAIIYNYKIIGYSGNIEKLRNVFERELKITLIKNNCSDKNAVKIYIPGIFSSKYNYIHDSGEKIWEFTFDNSLCH